MWNDLMHGQEKQKKFKSAVVLNTDVMFDSREPIWGGFVDIKWLQGVEISNLSNKLFGITRDFKIAGLCNMSNFFITEQSLCE